MLVIKKRVNLEYLGDDFKDSYLVFKSIPAKDLPDIVDKAQVDDNMKAIPVILGVLKTYFIEGKHQNEDVKKEELDDLDAESLINCFQTLTGQDIDPKDEGQLTNTSTTEAQPPQK